MLAFSASMALCLAAGSAAGPAVAAPAAGTGVLRAAVVKVASTTAATKTATAKTVGINTSSQAAVTAAYLDQWAPTAGLSVKWTGSNAACRAGSTSATSQRAILVAVNFARALEHLAPVAYDATLSAAARNAALIMSANQTLNHNPPKSYRCWTKSGAAAAGHSNLAYGYPSLTVGQTVAGYLTDPGTSNTAVGHRRWLLYPPTTKIGSGSTSTTNAIYVVGPHSASRPHPTWVSWPTPGWFPTALQPAGRWSLSSGYDHPDFSQAKVTVTDSSGHRLTTHVYPTAVGYGDPTLVWKVTGLKKTGRYLVKVTGIKRQGSSHVSYSYHVNLYAPHR